MALLHLITDNQQDFFSKVQYQLLIISREDSDISRIDYLDYAMLKYVNISALFRIIHPCSGAPLFSYHIVYNYLLPLSSFVAAERIIIYTQYSCIFLFCGSLPKIFGRLICSLPADVTCSVGNI